MCIECNFNHWEYTIVKNMKCFITINWWQELYAFMYLVQNMLMQYSYKLWMLHQPTFRKSVLWAILCKTCSSLAALFFTSKRLMFAFVQYSCLLHLSNLSAKETRSHVFRDKNIPWNHVMHAWNIEMSVWLYSCICNTFHTLYLKPFNWMFLYLCKKKKCL